MTGARLKKLISRNRELARILTGLSEVQGSPFAVENSRGEVIYGDQAGASPQRFPIQLGDQTLGWVSGEAGSPGTAMLAELLSYVARQEDEKQSLTRELLDRYRELSLLYHLAERLATSPDPMSVSEIALGELRRLIQADVGAVLLLDGGELRPAAYFGIEIEAIQPTCLLERILETGKAELANDIPASECIGGKQEHRISMLGAPLVSERRTLGIIFLAGEQQQVYTAGELKLLNTIAMQVVPALEISRLYQELIEKARFEQELRVARQVQESLLPQRLPEIPGWSVAMRWRPAHEVSGDFYDVINVNDQTLELVIADVTDKGMPASLFMVFTRSILRVSIYSGDEPVNVITSVNQSICRDSYEGLFTSLVYARLDQETGKLTYVNAGHNPPLLYHAHSGKIETLIRTGLPLGVDLNAAYTQQEIYLEEGDFILFYTDGITEATNAQQEEFGIERLKRQVLKDYDCEVDEILDGIETALQAFTLQGGPLDDATLLGLKRKKQPGGKGW